MTATERAISTHTPAWGATFFVAAIEGASEDFNSHARVGRDPDFPACDLGKENYNSHARVGRDVGN